MTVAIGVDDVTCVVRNEFLYVILCLFVSFLIVSFDDYTRFR